MLFGEVLLQLERRSDAPKVEFDSSGQTDDHGVMLKAGGIEPADPQQRPPYLMLIRLGFDLEFDIPKPVAVVAKTTFSAWPS